MEENPKLHGSCIIDAIPQVGECPNHCSECFYNGGRFYRTLDTPLLPSPEDVGLRIVRVNSGNDSNNQREDVIRSTAQYRHKFYNTAVPNFDFPGPVVLTINPQHDKKPHLVSAPPNLMFVRVRAGMWDKTVVADALDHYRPQGVPVVVTFMRYYNADLIPLAYKKDYVWKKHILNDYCCATTTATLEFMKAFAGTGVRMCGTPYSSLCVDCGHCEDFYWHTIRRMGAHEYEHMGRTTETERLEARRRDVLMANVLARRDKR